MSFSIQTNVNALVAQQNLSVNSAFQSRTIQRLTSGYRINSSADDAAGLAVANRFRSDTAELSQGVRNANDGVSQLQIVDGGLANISMMLDRMKTLATQSASSGFTGDRSTLNSEYSQLLSEIDRQAANIGLNNGGNLNKNLAVYIGGAHASNTAGSGAVSVDLSSKTVDQAGLSLTGSSVAGGAGSGAVDMTVGTGGRLDNPATLFVQAGSQAFTFNYVDTTGAAQSRVVTVNGGSAGISGNAVISQLNTGLAGTGLTAAVEASATNTGQLSITGANGFSVYAGSLTGTNSIAAATTSVVNTAQYNLTTAGVVGTFSAATVGDHETFTVSDGTNKAVVTLDSTNASGTSATVIANAINAFLKAGTAMSGTGTGGSGHAVAVTAIASANDTKISFQSSANFSVDETLHTNTNAANMLFAAVGSQATVASTGGAGSGATANATAALALINSAVSTLGTVQGIVGAGQNKLNYAISLAQSQITGYSTAESQIRDADVASEAANLTKASVLQQASMAAMAQANSAPQAVLTLLRG
jgi:flagellin